MNLKECEIIYAQHFPFWDKLTQREKIELCQNTSIETCAKNQSIHSGGQYGHCLGVIFVKSGKLRAYMMSEDGREVTVYRVPKGEICALSASCAINSITFDLFIDADDDTELMIINMIFFRKLMDSNIWFKNFIYELISARFSDVMWIMQQILFSSFDKRLAVFLLDEFDSAGEDILKMTHEQIAKYVGSAREVVSRMLKYFEREEIVQLSRGGIKLIDRKALENILG